jgi:hypothetical protein
LLAMVILITFMPFSNWGHSSPMLNFMINSHA